MGIWESWELWPTLKHALIILLVSFGVLDMVKGGHFLGIACLLVACILLIA